MANVLQTELVNYR